MADEEPSTPKQACEAIQHAFHRVENQFPDSHAVQVLKRHLSNGIRQHGHHFGFNDEEIAALAGGGIPKLPPPGGGG